MDRVQMDPLPYPLSAAMAPAHQFCLIREDYIRASIPLLSPWEFLLPAVPEMRILELRRCGIALVKPRWKTTHITTFPADGQCTHLFFKVFFPSHCCFSLFIHGTFKGAARYSQLPILAGITDKNDAEITVFNSSGSAAWTGSEDKYLHEVFRRRVNKRAGIIQTLNKHWCLGAVSINLCSRTMQVHSSQGDKK